MTKTAVSTLIDDIKILADYNIEDSDLDALILKAMNYGMKRMKQWFFDEQMYDEIGAHDILTTVALQEYIELDTSTVDFDQQIVLTERVNDNEIEVVTFQEYRQRFPDPSDNSSDTPDIAAFFANRVYFGPTPASAISIYLDYIKLLTKLISTDTFPFEDKYDELVVAICIEYLIKWLDRTNLPAIAAAKADVKEYKQDLIVVASKNVGMNQQSQSRREERPFFSPRKVI